MDFVEEDMTHETYEVQDDSTLIRIPNQSDNNTTASRNTIHRSTHNKENVCNNVTVPDVFQTILANIGIDDDVQLFTHFFEVVEKSDNNHIKTKCLGCEKPYQAQLNVVSNLVKHLKVGTITLRSIEFFQHVFFCFLLQRKHPYGYDIYESHRKRSKININTKNELSQSKFNDLLQKFLVDGLKTYSMVEEPAFRDFVHGLYSKILSFNELNLIFVLYFTDFCGRFENQLHKMYGISNIKCTFFRFVTS